MDTPEYLSALRNEIVESQKTQAEFLKWKLIAVGVVSSISLGLTDSHAKSASSPYEVKRNTGKRGINSPAVLFF